MSPHIFTASRFTADGGRVGGAVGTPTPIELSVSPERPPTRVVQVGAVDTGVLMRDGRPHPFLDGRVRFAAADVEVHGGQRPTRPDLRGHGTFVAGLICRESRSAVVELKGVLDKDTGDVEDEAVAEAVGQLAGDDVRLINLSFTGHATETFQPPAIVRALRRLPADAVVVAAAGNSFSPEPRYPAAIDLGPDHALIIAVGAVDETRPPAHPGASPPRAPFSNHGNWVDVYTNGCQLAGPALIESEPVDPDWGWVTWSGTSFAAAIVTGVIAQLSVDKGLSLREAADEILAGRLIPIEDGGDKPYVRSRTSNWPALS